MQEEEMALRQESALIVSGVIPLMNLEFMSERKKMARLTAPARSVNVIKL
jgi:hypothetical protein